MTIVSTLNLIKDIAPYLAASVALFVGFGTWRINLRIARRKASIDHILDSQKEPAKKLRKKYFFLREKFLDATGSDNPYSLPYLAHADAENEDRQTIFAILNAYEVIGLAISQGAFCEKTYKKWLRSTLVQDRIDLDTFILSFRSVQTSKRKVIFERFDNLAKKWATPEELKRIH